MLRAVLGVMVTVAMAAKVETMAAKAVTMVAKEEMTAAKVETMAAKETAKRRERSKFRSSGMAPAFSSATGVVRRSETAGMFV
ncbi:hypothetical protein ACOTTU_21370 [Roseobacter sp. EG26]|uniref:hypothetical protein n=1 Tax=Roseobacter sp. EG26 TaxID=3412477 RepID=UPI003CE49129